MKILRKKNKIKNKFYGPFSWTGLTCLQVLSHYLAVDHLHSYLNQMPKPLSHSFDNLRTEKKLTILIELFR